MANGRWLFIHPFQLRLQRGIEVYLWNLTLALKKIGQDVDILTWDGPLDVPDYVSGVGIHVLRIPSVRYFQNRFAIPFYIWHFLTGKYDHVFIHFAGYGEGESICLVRFLRVFKYSVVFHFPPSLVPHRFREFEKWELHRTAEHLIAVSRATSEEVKNWSGFSCEVIEHGVNTERFKPDPNLKKRIRTQLGFAKQDLILISTAALEERKGIQWGINVMAQLLQEFPNLYYLILGEGNYRNQLEKQILDLGLKKNVFLLGAKLNVYPYLCAADIILVLSQGEASSISLLEAMACQLPSITSNCPPFDELVKESWGIKVDEHNTYQLISTISGLLRDESSRQKMGLSAREHIIKTHQWSQIARKYQNVINGTNN